MLILVTFREPSLNLIIISHTIMNQWIRILLLLKIVFRTKYNVIVQ